jgi:hypothetical protein
VVSVHLPEPTAPPLLHQSRCASSLHPTEPPPFLSYHAKSLDLTKAQSASLIGRQRCITISPMVTSASSHRHVAPRCRCLSDLARQVQATS